VIGAEQRFAVVLFTIANQCCHRVVRALHNVRTASQSIIRMREQRKIDANVSVLAADMKGEGHGYSHREPNAVSGIHLFHRQPHLARIVVGNA